MQAVRGEILLRARAVHKSYGAGEQAIPVLKGVDLEVRRGEMIAVVGASGSGKTTLLHILGTLDTPASGELVFNGRDLLRVGDSALCYHRNEQIGFIFQFHHLLPEFTALENVMMPGFIGGRETNELRRSAMNLLEMVGLANRAEHRSGELSGGEQQRVALARALVMQPSLLLADEPTGNLDSKNGRMVFDLLREMSRSLELAVVMVTHNLELAAEMDRRLTLKDGMLSS